MKRARHAVAALVSLGLLVAVAPASAADPADPADPVARAAPDATSADARDPWEGFNRKIFAFNDFLSLHLLEPVGRGWKWLAPAVVRDSIARVFVNVRTPVVMVNDLLQGKPREAGIDLARLLLNTSVGLGGLMDPAGACGLGAHDEDFGQTLGVWGVPSGPYLMLPIFGPSSVRDASGRVVDTAATAYGYFVPLFASVAIRAGEIVNEFSGSAEDIAAEREAAFDWYAAVRNAYVSHREKLVRDEAGATATGPGGTEEEELYLPGEEFEE
jgi:phospholipid-binding lipoprotein MlaA